jgi:hypothetical protein
MTYGSIKDIIDYEVIPALDDPNDFDVEEIAVAISKYEDGSFEVAVDEDTFWEIVQNNQRTGEE